MARKTGESHSQSKEQRKASARYVEKEFERELKRPRSRSRQTGTRGDDGKAGSKRTALGRSYDRWRSSRQKNRRPSR